jgi:nitroimidazol reductase NimA-like FMN-containing flavoprotein (pyridoxamine 5'-phosphate oxidase superfamily)
MRRKDREVTEIREIIEIIEKCDVCRLALFAEQYPYIVPLNFGFIYDGAMLTLYFHGAKSGTKLELIKQNPHAGFAMDCAHRLIAREKACNYSMAYESVVGYGDIEFVLDIEEKHRALRQLMAHYVPEQEFDFDTQDLAAVTVFKLIVRQVTGKRVTVS